MKLTPIKPLIYGAVALVVLGFSQSAVASVEIKMIEPKKFRDVELSGKTKQRSIDTVKKDLKKLFTTVSKPYVGEKETLLIEVLDIDLPGYMDYVRGEGNRDIRIVKDNEPYRLKFRYQTKDSQGNVVKSGEKLIKQFMTRFPLRIKQNRTGTVIYFEEDLEKWFEAEYSK
ncbi:MAG: DUF3016 domain-containing protein [Kangiellaceae bacterium]|nr:DUF3016 domain-containing protein [Kangiellaceae bacterium]MCW8998007.1 DUF3016 domain-containing protein [Kangiellaceae bacterium]MCW9017768.1 DUF3016 domain-containing protein [Kangiellaceae bacterium]